MQEEFERINLKIDAISDLQHDTYRLVREQTFRVDGHDKRIEALEKKLEKAEIFREERLWKSKGFWGILTGTTALIIEAINAYARVKGYR
jgi:hypothetical protein